MPLELNPNAPAVNSHYLDAVARLEANGRRREAAAIRAEATETYSKAWNAAAERRLHQLLRDADPL